MRKRKIQILLTVPLDQAPLRQYSGESDFQFYERMLKVIDLADLKKGAYGSFGGSVQVVDESGQVIWQKGG